MRAAKALLSAQIRGHARVFTAKQCDKYQNFLCWPIYICHWYDVINSLFIGSYMSAHVSLNLLNKLKRDKM